MARNCPNCSSAMQVETIHGIGVDVCLDCGGLWFDSDELRVLFAQPADVLDELQHLNQTSVSHSKGGVSKMLCPDCEVLLDEYHYMYNSPLIIKSCSHCGGFFVTEGELAQMREWREMSHSPLTHTEQAAALMAEAVAEHENFLHRQRIFRDFFKVLRIHQPGFFGM